jgi:hypothetical protein
MTLRIDLCEDDSGPRSVIKPLKRQPVHPSTASVAAFAEWNDDRIPPMMLFLADEPEFGKRFQYVGVEWEIVDYRDGWVARLLVD